MLKFFIQCEPPKTTHQAGLRIIHPKGKKPFIGRYEKSEAKAAEKRMMGLLQPHVPPQPYDEPICVTVEWTYPWNKSETKKRKAEGWQPCGTRPDIDNLCKTLFDTMTKLGFWTDDGRICSLRFVKGWGDNPGIGIKIEKWS